MKILATHPDFAYGGGDFHFYDLICAMKEEDCLIVESCCIPGDWFHPMIYTAFKAFMKWGRQFDMLLLDNCATSAPIFKLLFNAPIFFLFFFPRSLIVKSDNFFQNLYSLELSWIEGWCFSFCDMLPIISRFSTRTLQQRHNDISLRRCPLFHPCLPSITIQSLDKVSDDQVSYSISGAFFLSLNRISPEKNHELAIEAFHCLKLLVPESVWNSVQLIIVGNYVERFVQCREYMEKLKCLIQKLELNEKVKIISNVDEVQKKYFLQNCTALLYTPPEEHFGLGVLEGMYFSKPVIASTKGGPVEIITNGKDGLLMKADAQTFAKGMAKVLLDDTQLDELKVNAFKTVQKKFMLDSFKWKLKQKKSSNSAGSFYSDLSLLKEKMIRLIENHKSDAQWRKVKPCLAIPAEKEPYRISQRFESFVQMERFSEALLGFPANMSLEFDNEEEKIEAHFKELQLYLLELEKQEIVRKQSELLFLLEDMWLRNKITEVIDKQLNLLEIKEKCRTKVEEEMVDNDADGHFDTSFCASKRNELAEVLLRLSKEHDRIMEDHEIEKRRELEENIEFQIEIEKFNCNCIFEKFQHHQISCCGTVPSTTTNHFTNMFHKTKTNLNKICCWCKSQLTKLASVCFLKSDNLN
ncbi:Alpha-1,3/1,6-mannosyltransferase ALG2 [Trichinella zimbabwensis]|uniref:Alpha-1,3/1,6-mannosyltransferase ALG2 n=1 Tax=Trichinella zimbabwensis TaxID=268475 RepID=A0A0V1HBJ6_9BILA|nr:Alpha-1,3/1,6-mannosyltransferase ALG2 [Trichinella zimbabwensis]